MGIHVCQSHNVEFLLEAVMRQLNQPTTSILDVFQTQSFIVPNKSVEKWLTQKIAEKTGITANYEYFNNISAFQWKAYQLVVEDKDKVAKSLMPRIIIKWRVFEAIKPYLAGHKNRVPVDAPLFSIVTRIYESAAQITDPQQALDKRYGMLYWVADQVSRLFTNYMTYRSQCDRHAGDCGCSNNWLQAWSQNRPANVEQWFNGAAGDELKLQHALKLEEWQRWLWYHLFADEYARFREVDDEFWTCMDSELTRRSALASLPRQLIVFTLLDLPPQQLNFLRKLGEHIEVMIYHYNPTQEYWADSVDSRWQKKYNLGVKERFIALNAEKGREISDLELKEYFEKFTLNFNAEARESRHPLLTRLGKQARDNFSLLSNLASGEEGEWFDLFVDDHSETTLLGKLKSDIFNLLEPEKSSYVLDPEDQSIRVNVCHSSVRQLEVLKEQILLWLDQAPAGSARTLEDILVMTPNIKAAEASIRSVFAPFAKGGSMTDVYLPIKITGIAQAPVINAWASVVGRINLTKGRFGFEEFADWLALPATQTLYGLEYVEVERMLALLKDAKFYRGFNSEHLQQDLPATDTDYRFNFKYALDRLSLAVFVDQQAVFDDVLSVDFVQTADFELIGKLHLIYQDLLDRSVWLSSSAEPKQVDKWFEVLLTEIKTYQDAGEEHLNVVMDVIHGLMRPLSMSIYADFAAKRSTASLVGMKLPLQYLLEEIQRGVDTQLEAAEPSGHITFCQAGYIRPLPYKLVVFLNLDGGSYPAFQHHNNFDLMSYLRPQLGDRSRLEDEQGAFLDAVLLAQENFWMFYNGFNLDGGQVLHPSGVLQELMEHIAFISHCGDSAAQTEYLSLQGVEVAAHIQQLYRIHSLHPFDCNGFAESDQRLKTHWYWVAGKIQSSDDQSLPWVDDVYVATQRPSESILGSRWVADVTFPAALYLGGLSVKNVKPEDLVAENEPLLLKGLESYAVRDAMQSRQDSAPDLIDDLLPVGKFKQSALKICQSQYQDMAERLKQVASEVTPTVIHQIRLCDDLQVSARVPEPAQGEKWVVLKSSSAYAEHRAKVWLEYLLWLADLDLGDQGQSHAMLVVFKDATIVSTGISSNQAKIYLSHWVRAWRYGMQQPLVLPAKLLLSPLEKKKKLQWDLDEATGTYTLAQMNDLIKTWNETFNYSPDFPLSENRANKKHRDWRYILLNQNSTELLVKCCQMFAMDLYKPIFDHQREFSEVEHAALLTQQEESSFG